MYKVIKGGNIYSSIDLNNKSEVYDLLEDLKKKKSKDARINRNKILAYIRLLERHGVLIGEPICKHLEGEIYELRPLDNRILFFYHEDDQYILLTHFEKKTNKTPKREIERAKSKMDEYISRKINNN